LLPAGAVAGWDLHPLESAAFARRTPEADNAAPYSGCQRTSTSGFGFSLTGQSCNSHRFFPFKTVHGREPKREKSCTIEPGQNGN